MTRPGGWNNERFEHLYFDCDALFIPCSTLILDQSLYDVLAGNTPGIVEYFADVTFGPSSTPLLYIDEIYTERTFENLKGNMHLGFHTATSPIAGLIANAEIKVVAGIRFNGKTATQQRFVGKIEEVVYPSEGQTRGTIDAFDDGQILADSSCNSGTLIGDVVSWIQTRASQLSMSTNFQVVPRTPGITLVNSHFLSYSSFSDAIKTVSDAFQKHYVFFTGLNELVILDPSILSAVTPLFTLASAGIQTLKEIDSASDRFNRIPYSNYSGYSKNFVTYQVSVQPDGTSSINGVTITGTGFLSGVYNDTADQATFGILSNDGTQNNICATDAELQTFCATVAEESQRARLEVEIAYNPFVDLGNVIQYDSENWVISRIRDRIQAGQIWKTLLELRAA